MLGVTADQARAAGKALVTATARTTGLMRTASHPDAKAIGEWTVTDLSVHLSHVIDALVGSAKGTGGLVDSVWDLGNLTALLLAGESERRLPALADRIDASVAGLLTLFDERDPAETVEWVVKGVHVPLAFLVCQTLSEVAIHGRDLALAEGQNAKDADIERSEARLIMLGSLFPVLDALGRTVVDQEAAAGAKAVFDVNLRGGGRVYMRFDDGDLSVTDTKPGKVDCHLSVDPGAFLLVAWGRGGQWSAILRGQLFAFGRKPWLGLKLRAWLRNP